MKQLVSFLKRSRAQHSIVFPSVSFLHKAIPKRHSSRLAPVFSCTATVQTNANCLSSLDSFSLWVQFTLRSQYIRLGYDPIMTWFYLTGFMWWTFVWAVATTAICLCERFLLVCQWEVKHADGFHTYRSKQDRSQHRFTRSILGMPPHNGTFSLHVSRTLSFTDPKTAHRCLVVSRAPGQPLTLNDR